VTWLADRGEIGQRVGSTFGNWNEVVNGDSVA